MTAGGCRRSSGSRWSIPHGSDRMIRRTSDVQPQGPEPSLRETPVRRGSGSPASGGQPSSLVPPDAGTERHGHGCDDHHGPGEARQVRLHGKSPLLELRHPTGNRAALGGPKIPGFASPSRGGFALDGLSDGGRLSSSTATLWSRSISTNDPLVPVSPGVRGSFQHAPDRSRQDSTRSGPAARFIATTMATVTPSPISTSPTLNTLAKGMPWGIAKMSVSSSSDGWASTVLFE
jgi:hypothetical protein